MKYLRRHKSAGRYFWRFNPPQDAVDAGIVSRKTFTDGRTARAYVSPKLKLIEDWKRGKLSGTVVANSTVDQLASNYFSSKQYLSKSINTQINYKHSIRSVCDTNITPKKTLGDRKIKSITAYDCSILYSKWLDKGTAYANRMVRTFGVLFNYAISLDIIDINPMVKIQKVPHKPEETTLWTQDQVVKFVDQCMTDFEYRSIGLIVLMAYEWGQRPTDIIHLKWSSIDLGKQEVVITQSKRGARVHLPIPDNLNQMLIEQQKDFGFQEYVVPNIRPADGAYRPYDRSTFSTKVKQVLTLAGLPDNLQAGTLRKTAINEMVENDVNPLEIMSVTGHQNISSLNPYIKRRLETAKTALEKRRNAK